MSSLAATSSKQLFKTNFGLSLEPTELKLSQDNFWASLTQIGHLTRESNNNPNFYSPYSKNVYIPPKKKWIDSLNFSIRHSHNHPIIFVFSTSIGNNHVNTPEWFFIWNRHTASEFIDSTLGDRLDVIGMTRRRLLCTSCTPPPLSSPSHRLCALTISISFTLSLCLWIYFFSPFLFSFLHPDILHIHARAVCSAVCMLESIATRLSIFFLLLPIIFSFNWVSINFSQCYIVR